MTALQFLSRHSLYRGSLQHYKLMFPIHVLPYYFHERNTSRGPARTINRNCLDQEVVNGVVCTAGSRTSAAAVRDSARLTHLSRGMQRMLNNFRANMAGKPINLVLDWDGTLTKTDTMFAMGRMADLRSKRLELPGDPLAAWDGFAKAYMEDYAAYEARYEPKARSRTDREAESAWLKRLEDVEVRSAARVQKHAFLRGVKREDINLAARKSVETGEVSLRPGWQKLLALSATAEEDPVGTSLNGQVSILSVNWSEAFIRASLKESAQYSDTEEIRDRLHKSIDALPILSNELASLESNYGSTGRLSEAGRPRIRTSYDKLMNFKREAEHLNVYVGDSTTDFDALLAADVGICICDDPMGSGQKGLADTLARVGCEVTHIDQADSHGLHGPTLLWARDLNEIYHFLLASQRLGDGTRSEG